MLSISGLLSGVSLIIILAISTILIKDRYTLENNYSYKIDNIVKQINNVNAANIEVEKNEQARVMSVENNMQDIRRNYIRKDDINKRIETENAHIKTLNIINGINILSPSPNPSSIYNIRTSDDSLYLHGSKNNANINIGFSNKNVIHINNDGMNVNGKIVIDNKNAFTSSANDIVRLTDNEGKDLKGTLAVRNVTIDNNAMINNGTFQNANVNGLFTVTGGISEHNPNKLPTVFNNNGMNSIRGNTDIYGNIKSYGNIDIGGKLSFDGNKHIKLNDGSFETQLHDDSTVYRLLKNENRIHEFDAKGNAKHANKMIVGDKVVIENGTKDGDFASISFNGMYNSDINADTVFNKDKSRWRLGVEQKNEKDTLFIDQTNANGSKNIYMTMKDNKIGVGTSEPSSKLHVVGGNIKQQTTKDGSMWNIGSEDASNGIMAYDGSSFSFSTKGIKIMSVTEKDAKLFGDFKVNSNVFVSNNIHGKSVWFEDTIGINRGEDGFINIRQRDNNLGGLNASILKANSILTGGILNNGELNVKNNAKFDESIFINKDVNITGNLYAGDSNTQVINIGTRNDSADIRIGSTGAFSALKDGNTYINSYKNGNDIIMGATNTSNIIIGEKTVNKIGESLMPNVDNNVFIRSANDKNIYIGDTSSSIIIGKNDSKVNVYNKLCVEDVCLNKDDFAKIKDLINN